MTTINCNWWGFYFYFKFESNFLTIMLGEKTSPIRAWIIEFLRQTLMVLTNIACLVYCALFQFAVMTYEMK